MTIKPTMTPSRFVFVFDFDQTITQKHIYGIQHKEAVKNPVENIRLAEQLRSFILAAFNLKHQVAIATFGDSSFKKGQKNPENFLAGEELVKAYFHSLFKNTPVIINRIEIQAFYAANKNLHLKNIKDKFPGSTLILFDDDKNNIAQARQEGYCTVHVTEHNWGKLLDCAQSLINNEITLENLWC